MINCQVFLNVIDDFVDSTLAPAERQRMEEHLRICSNCRKELEGLKSLLERSAELSEQPQRDLWPRIEAGMKPAVVSQTASPRQAAGSAFSTRAFRLAWRLAAVAILGTIILLAATYFRNRSSAPVSRMAGELTDNIRTNGSSEPGEAQGKQDSRPALLSHQTGANELQTGVSAGNYMEACQCAPSPRILDLIDKGSIVDESLPSWRAQEFGSEQLFVLAGQNSDDFFLHKASLENERYTLEPLPVASSTATRRYLSKLAQRPNDPVWTYLYAHSLFGKNTPEMIRLMLQLAGDHSDFPWPNLILARVYAISNSPYTDKGKARSYLQGFMKLCPESPEPLHLMVSFSDSDFFTDSARRMRANLAMRSDVQSLLLYQRLWYLENILRASGEELPKIQQRIREDLKRLEGLEPGRRKQLAAIIRIGYHQIGDVDTFRKLFEEDTSWSGRWGAVNLRIQEWNRANPLPPTDASDEKWTTYWGNRLKLSESLIGKMPQNPIVWTIKLEALAALKNRPDGEFLEAASKVLALEREEPETPELPIHWNWRSNLLKLASLCANQGLLLDAIPALIGEGYAISQRRQLKYSNDLFGNPQWVSILSRFNAWVEADEAWHLLADAYLRSGEPDNARRALDSIEVGITEFKSLLAQADAQDDGGIIKAQRKTMADKLAKLEERYAATRAGIQQAARK